MDYFSGSFFVIVTFFIGVKILCGPLYNIPKELSENDIKNEIKRQGDVNSEVRLVKDTLGKSSGKAEVRFETKEEMKATISKFHIVGRIGGSVVRMREFDSKESSERSKRNSRRLMVYNLSYNTFILYIKYLILLKNQLKIKITKVLFIYVLNFN